MSQRIHQGQPMNLQGRNALHGRISSILITVRCFLRGLPLFVCDRPLTPLRVLCIMAFDTVHMIRDGKPLPMRTLRILAAFLDFGACANAAFDKKKCRRHEYRKTLQLLEEAGIRTTVVEYLRRLKELETRRPLPGGDYWQFQKVGSYREAVVRLSLGMVATTANFKQCLDEGIRATRYEGDLSILFQIAMQCQIIDDVLDYSTDMPAGLPSFLTACKSLSQAYELTRLASLAYADDQGLPRTGDLFPLRSALFLVSTCTKLVIFLGRWRQRPHFGTQLPRHACGPRLRAGDGVEKFPRLRTLDSQALLKELANVC